LLADERSQSTQAKEFLGPQRLWPGERSAVMVSRPKPEVVSETLRSLKKAGAEVVLIRRLVQALRDRTGCSRATAYRAVQDAFEAGVIGWC